MILLGLPTVGWMVSAGYRRNEHVAGWLAGGLLTGTGLTPRLKQLAEELTHQYKVTYAQPQRLIQPEQVTVSAAHPGLTVRGVAEPAREIGRAHV